MDKNLRLDFYNYLNKNCKLPEETEDKILKLNLILTNSFSPKNLYEQNNINNYKNQKENNATENSSTFNSIQNSLNYIKNTEDNLKLLDTQVDMSINKLSSIIDSRNNLQNTLKDFNVTTKKVLNEKEKMGKLLKYIKSYYNFYIDTISIYEFLKNESCVVKYRFTEDYQKILDGIGFFSLNTNFTESSTYLQKYKTLKVMSINKYYEYIDKSINNNHITNLIPPEEGSFLDLLINELDDEEIKLDIKEKYFLYLNQEKMKNLIAFFEEESKDDEDVKPSHNKLKTKYIDIRTSLIKNIYSEIFKEINNNFYNHENHKTFNTRFNILLRKIILHSFIEIVHYGELFGHNYRNDVYILQSLVKFIYNSLYDTIRPLIASMVSLEDLIIIFDAFTKSTAIFFLNITPTNTNPLITEENDINKKFIEDENKEIISFFKKFLPKTPEEIILGNLFIFRNFLDINQHLMRPTLLHLIQDLQEKIYIKVSIHIKNNFNEIEQDFPSFGLYEEKWTSNDKYKYFPFFHYFLKRIVILYEIFNKKLEDKIVSQIITSAIETFISELNNELLNKKNLNYEFQIYMIQQILLCLQTVNNFNIDIIKVDIDLGKSNNSVTDAFKINYEPIIKGKISIRQMLKSFRPEIMETTKDFKKILYNNLLKCYKMFINLSNEFVFGTKILDIYSNINKNEKNNKENIIKKILENEEEFCQKLKDVDCNKKIVGDKFGEQIKNIDDNVFDKIMKVFEDNVTRIKNELGNFIKENNNIKGENNDKLVNIIKLFN
jgi:hypothetical protein